MASTIDVGCSSCGVPPGVNCFDQLGLVALGYAEYHPRRIFKASSLPDVDPQIMRRASPIRDSYINLGSECDHCGAKGRLTRIDFGSVADHVHQGAPHRSVKRYLCTQCKDVILKWI